MKQKGIFIVMVAMMMITSCATQQQKAERKAEMQKAVTEAIASKKMHIDIKSMNTLRYGVKTVTPDFFLELRGDTLQSYLPYMGQAHTAPMMSPSLPCRLTRAASSQDVFSCAHSAATEEMPGRTRISPAPVSSRMRFAPL